jgi:hypothetical protein
MSPLLIFFALELPLSTLLIALLFPLSALLSALNLHVLDVSQNFALLLVQPSDVLDHLVVHALPFG